MSLQLTGVIKQITEPQQINEKLTKQLLVIETQGQYPQLAQFEVVNKPELLNGYAAGQTVIVSFDVRGREYQDRIYTSLHAWKIELAN